MKIKHSITIDDKVVIKHDSMILGHEVYINEAEDHDTNTLTIYLVKDGEVNDSFKVEAVAVMHQGFGYVSDHKLL